MTISFSRSENEKKLTKQQGVAKGGGTHTLTSRLSYTEGATVREQIS